MLRDFAAYCETVTACCSLLAFAKPTVEKNCIASNPDLYVLLLFLKHQLRLDNIAESMQNQLMR